MEMNGLKKLLNKKFKVIKKLVQIIDLVNVSDFLKVLQVKKKRGRFLKKNK